MKGGAIEFSFIPFTPNGRQNLSKVYTKQGTKLLLFIDGTQDTFFNTFRRVKFSKSCSKVYFYLTDYGQRIEDHTPFQLIYQTDNLVYQYNTTEVNRLRLVKQNSLIKDTAEVERLLNVTLKMLNENLQNLNSNPEYQHWERQLYDAIISGQISIDQIYNFLYEGGNNHKRFKAGKYVGAFWTKFHQKYEREFF